MPEVLIEIILILMPYLEYRTHHEAIIEAIRRFIADVVKTISKLNKLKAYKKLTKNFNETFRE